MSVYSVDKRWANRDTLKKLFSIPFIQLGVKRVQTVCSAHDDGVIMFNKRIGFKQEGLHKEAFPDGGDAISFGMLKGDCKWL
jgi:RimJ/RimL family protein N-acetyltransferase